MRICPAPTVCGVEAEGRRRSFYFAALRDDTSDPRGLKPRPFKDSRNLSTRKAGQDAVSGTDEEYTEGYASAAYA